MTSKHGCCAKFHNLLRLQLHIINYFNIFIESFAMRTSAFLVFLLMSQWALGQTDHITTIMISSVATPERLQSVIEKAHDEGIFIDPSSVVWNKEKDRIKEIDFSLQFQKKDGTLGKATTHQFRYNVLTEGTILLLQRGSDYPAQILVDNAQLFEHMGDIINPYPNVPNTLYATFSDPVDVSNSDNLKKARTELSWRLRESNELVNQLRKERESGSVRYRYRYYYNGQRLNGSLGISAVDMKCDATVSEDADGVLSLQVQSELPLSPYAIVAQ